MIRVALTLLLLAAPSAVAAGVTPSTPSRNWPAPADRNDALLRQVALRLHNHARTSFGVAPVAWSIPLEVEAQAYADTMARTGVYGHDLSQGRKRKMGENLWRGPRGVFAYEVMIGLMVDEDRHFRPGVFPNVSATGEWHDVGHYTQIVWPTTTEIGCAVAASATTDYLVCRYAPKGNQDGFALTRGRPAVQLAERRD